MSETEPVPEPSRATKPPGPSASEPAADRQRSTPGHAGVPLLVGLIALGLAIGLAVAAYFTWNQVQQLVRQQSQFQPLVEERIQPLRSDMKDLTGRVQHERQQLGRRLEKLDEEQQGIGKRVSVLAALLGRSEQGWSLAEVEYLLRIANQRLQLQRDLNSAAIALRSADARLRELADPHYLAVREQIARDLEALESVPKVDIDGLAVTLGIWLEQVEELPVAGVRRPALDESMDAGAEPGAEPDSGALNWQELPTVIGKALSDLFRLREHDAPVVPLLPPEQEYFLRENLRLQLASARLALLRADARQYQAILATARQWLTGYFATDNELVSQLAADLERLRGENIQPQLPEIAGSLRLLHQQMKLGEQQQVLPVVPTPESAGGSPPADPAGEVVTEAVPEDGETDTAGGAGETTP